ncbi:unnamed protein product [Pocillopora meandrina]|uniref:Uncharacterized protein n=1 Tax=Pocillopora meandrina TaxID=46732 RepID=A0AAU9X0L8_9CNID|nr:unnamed protein product [Pocillopora meandrina]
MVQATERPEQKNASTERIREPSGSEKENEVCELDNRLSKWSFKSVAEVLFDESRFFAYLVLQDLGDPEI